MCGIQNKKTHKDKGFVRGYNLGTRVAIAVACLQLRPTGEHIYSRVGLAFGHPPM